MKFSLTQALPLDQYDLSLLTEVEIQYIKKKQKIIFYKVAELSLASS